MTEKETITFKYNNKEYEIEKKEATQGVTPKDDEDGDRIKVENYKKEIFNHTAEIDGEKVNLKGTATKHVVSGGFLISGLIFAVLLAYNLGWKKRNLLNSEDTNDEEKK